MTPKNANKIKFKDETTKLPKLVSKINTSSPQIPTPPLNKSYDHFDRSVLKMGILSKISNKNYKKKLESDLGKS